jgi:hypothetical protein
MKLLIYVYCYLRKYYKAPDEDASKASGEALIAICGLLSSIVFGIILIISGLTKNFMVLDFFLNFEGLTRRFIVIPLLLVPFFITIYLILKSKKKEIERVQLLIEEGHRYSKKPGWVAFYCWLVFSLVMLLGLASIAISITFIPS